jgi:pimeloyl-ACP methyl ester carboxylesterase
MLAITAALPDAPSGRPPVVLVHGAANSAGVWTFWQRSLAEAGWPSYAIDLRGHGRSDAIDLSRTSMRDYAGDVRVLMGQLARPAVLIGWSMGGLVAMLAAAEGDALACVGLAPSTAARAVDASVALRQGEFGPEEYGITSREPARQPAMPDLDREEREVALASLGRESRLARDERKAGVVIESLPCPLLIVTGTADAQWPRSRYAGLWLAADEIEVHGASHWGLVLNRRALATLVPQVVAWVGRVAGDGSEH